MASLVAKKKGEQAERRAEKYGVEWEPDAAVTACPGQVCGGKAFGMIRRKHHCRNCGRIYCKDCLGNKVRRVCVFVCVFSSSSRLFSV
jgi:hypothetical protein